MVSSLVLMLAAWELNRLAFYLSPLALAIIFFYSFTKRFTRWSHLLLGFALGIAPAAAWIAIRGSLDLRILLLTAAVTCWVAGFDVLYACQDCDFDRQHGLHSIPRFVGIERALMAARILHAVMLLLLVAVIMTFGLGKLAALGVTVVALLVGYEHSLVRANDLSRLNPASGPTECKPPTRRPAGHESRARGWILLHRHDLPIKVRQIRGFGVCNRWAKNATIGIDRGTADWLRDDARLGERGTDTS